MSDKTRYNDAELSEFEAIIDEKISKAQKELDYYLEQIRIRSESDDSKLKGVDDAAGSQESEQLQIRAARQTKLIRHLDNAKLRIKNKVLSLIHI